MALWTAPVNVWACASCSTGGDEPLVMYPNERRKVSLSLTHSAGLRYLKANGQVGGAMLPDSQDTVTFGAGAAISPRGYVSAGMPLLRNGRAGRSVWGLGDVTVAGRYTLLPATFVAPGRPQVQLLGSFKAALGRSEFDAVRADGLGAFGGGFDEVRLGLDVWFGMRTVKAGLAGVGIFALPRQVGRALLAPGATLRTMGTLAWGRDGVGRLTVSVVRDVQGPLQRDAVAQGPASQKFATSVSVSAEATFFEVEVVRLTYARIAALQSFNANQAHNVALAYLHAW